MKKSVNNYAKKMLVIIVMAITANFNTAFGQVPAPDFDTYPVIISPLRISFGSLKRNC